MPAVPAGLGPGAAADRADRGRVHPLGQHRGHPRQPARHLGPARPAAARRGPLPPALHARCGACAAVGGVVHPHQRGAPPAPQWPGGAGRRHERALPPRARRDRPAARLVQAGRQRDRDRRGLPPARRLVDHDARPGRRAARGQRPLQLRVPRDPALAQPRDRDAGGADAADPLAAAERAHHRLVRAAGLPGLAAQLLLLCRRGPAARGRGRLVLLQRADRHDQPGVRLRAQPAPAARRPGGALAGHRRGAAGGGCRRAGALWPAAACCAPSPTPC